MNNFFELLLRNTNNILDLLTFVRFCDEGYNIIRKTCGKPDKIYNKSGICFKIPIIQGFDKVNMKKQVHYLNAHSRVCSVNKLMPYNITIDAQIEYKIINPLVIYKINCYDDARHGSIRAYIDNEIHLMLDEILKNKDIDIQKAIDEKLIYRNSKKDDDFIKKSILIERVIICGYEYSIGIKNAR